MTALALRLLRRPGLLAPLAAVVLVGVVWWFGWMAPEQATLAAARVTRATDTAEISSLETRLAQLRIDARHEVAARRFVRRFAAEIPARADAPQLVSQIYALAERSGVRLQSISDNTVVGGGGGYSTVPVALTVSGQQAGIVSFVGGLYHLVRLVTVQRLNLSGPSSGNVVVGTRGLYSASIAATAYTTAASAGQAPGNVAG